MQEHKPGSVEKVIYTTSSILMYISTGLLLVMLLLGTADVLGRYLFNNPITGTQEIFEILLPGIVLLGWAYAQRVKSHVTVDIIYNRFSPRLKAIAGLFITSLAIVITALIVWQGIVESMANFQMGRMIRNIDVPIFIPQLLVPIGAFSLFLVLIIDFSTYVREIRKG